MSANAESCLLFNKRQHYALTAILGHDYNKQSNPANRQVLYFFYDNSSKTNKRLRRLKTKKKLRWIYEYHLYTQKSEKINRQKQTAPKEEILHPYPKRK